MRCSNCEGFYFWKVKSNGDEKGGDGSAPYPPPILYGMTLMGRHDSALQAVRTVKYHAAKYEEYIARWKAGLESGMRGKTQISNHIRRYLFTKFHSRCALCGWGEIHPTTLRVPLEVEHIDGDFTNNVESNLILLCPNCHSLTPTYRSLNRGNGRPRK